MPGGPHALAWSCSLVLARSQGSRWTPQPSMACGAGNLRARRSGLDQSVTRPLWGGGPRWVDALRSQPGLRGCRAPGSWWPVPGSDPRSLHVPVQRQAEASWALGLNAWPKATLRLMPVPAPRRHQQPPTWSDAHLWMLMREGKGDGVTPQAAWGWAQEVLRPWLQVLPLPPATPPRAQSSSSPQVPWVSGWGQSHFPTF